MRYDDLRKYLDARRKGGFGWLARFDQEVCGGGEIDMAVLYGHRCALLDAVLDLIPERLLREAIDVAEEIEERRRDSRASITPRRHRR